MSKSADDGSAGYRGSGRRNIEDDTRKRAVPRRFASFRPIHDALLTPAGWRNEMRLVGNNWHGDSSGWRWFTEVMSASVVGAPGTTPAFEALADSAAAIGEPRNADRPNRLARADERIPIPSDSALVEAEGTGGSRSNPPVFSEPIWPVRIGPGASLVLRYRCPFVGGQTEARHDVGHGG